jgi:hypothetical protein
MRAGHGRLGSREPGENPDRFLRLSRMLSVELRILPQFGNQRTQGHGALHRGEFPARLVRAGG